MKWIGWEGDQLKCYDQAEECCGLLDRKGQEGDGYKEEEAKEEKYQVHQGLWSDQGWAETFLG